MPQAAQACYPIAVKQLSEGRPMTLRSRLTISYVGFFAIALIVLDIGLYLIVRQALVSNIDDDLQRGAQFLQQDFVKSNETLRGNERLRAFFNDNSVFI